MAETSRHDDADSHVLRSRSSGAVARIWGVPLCGVSSGCGEFRGWLGVVECAVADHGVQGQDAAVGQGEDGLVMAFALVAFALVVGPGDGVGAQGGEGGQEHGALEPLVAAVGDAPRHGSMSRSGV